MKICFAALLPFMIGLGFVNQLRTEPADGFSRKPEASLFVSRSALPQELIGQWQFGSASMTEIWDRPTNTFLGNAFELSVRFQFKANGEYEEYFVAASRSMGSNEGQF